MLMEERLNTLEQSLAKARRLNRASLIGLSLLAVAALLVAAKPATERKLRASAFVLEDAHGRVFGSFQITDAGASLELRDNTGTARAVLSAAPEAVQLALMDSAGEPVFRAGALKETSIIGVMGETGKILLSVPQRSTGLTGPMLGVADSRGILRTAIRVKAEKACLEMFDESQQVRVKLESDAQEGVSRLAFKDADGHGRVGLSAVTDTSHLILIDKDDTRHWYPPREP